MEQKDKPTLRHIGQQKDQLLNEAKILLVQIEELPTEERIQLLKRISALINLEIKIVIKE